MFLRRNYIHRETITEILGYNFKQHNFFSKSVFKTIGTSTTGATFLGKNINAEHLPIMFNQTEEQSRSFILLILCMWTAFFNSRILDRVKSKVGDFQALYYKAVNLSSTNVSRFCVKYPNTGDG